MKLVNLIPLKEIDFRNQKDFDAYNKAHKLRKDTKVNIAGKNTTAGAATGKVQGTSVFGGNDKEKTSTHSIPKAQPGSFLDIFKKLNPGYDANKTLADFSKTSGSDLSDKEDRADHKKYVKNATEWFKKMATAKPTVKVGDLVKVNMRSDGKNGIGKIVKPITMQGSYGFMGQVAPDKQPGWKIDCYTEKNIGTTKKPIDVNGKKYYYKGTLSYAQHEEGDKNAFSKLDSDKNIKLNPTSFPKSASKLNYKHAESLEKSVNAETGLNGFVNTDDNTDAIMYNASSGANPTYTLYFGGNAENGEPDEFRVTLEPTYGNDPAKLSGKIDKTFKSGDDAKKFMIAVAKKHKKELQMDDEQNISADTSTKLSSMLPKSAGNTQYDHAAAFNKKVSKLTANNNHSQAAVELASYMDDKDAVLRLQQIKKNHDKRGFITSQEATERNALTTKLLQKAKKELPKKDFDLINSAF